MSLRLCRSEKVKNPYYVSFLGVNLYSSQELAYVIYHYPLLVMDCLVDERLLDFLREDPRFQALLREGEGPCATQP